MSFTSLLAKRYIKSQKRNAVLTICSIILSVSLMVMLFSCVTTYTSIMRASAYNDFPGHFYIRGMSVKNVKELEKLESVEKVTVTSAKGEYVNVYVTINDVISTDEYYEKLCGIAGVSVDNAGDDWQTDAINSELLEYDGYSPEAALKKAQIMAIVFILGLLLWFVLRFMIDNSFEISSKEREQQE